MHCKFVRHDITVWYAFNDDYVDGDVRFGAAESDTKAWMEAYIDLLLSLDVHFKSV